MSELWGPFVEEVPNYLDDLKDNLGTPLSEFIQSGEPKSVLGQVSQASERQACRQWARGQGRQNRRNDAFRREVCEGYLKDIGEWPGDEGISSPGFSGGQCPIEYDIGYLVDVIELATGNLFTQLGGQSPGFGIYPVGPIQRIALLPNGDGDIAVTVVNGGGQRYFFGANTAPSTFRFQNVRFTYVTPRNPGQSDDCGDPIPEPIPAPELPDPIDQPGVPPGTPPSIDLPITVNIDPDGTVNVDIGGEGGSYEPTPEGRDSDPENPGGSGEPGDSAETGDGGEDEGYDPDRILVGVRVEMLEVSPRARVTLVGQTPHHKGPYAIAMGGDAGLEVDTESAWAPPDVFYHAPEESNRYRVSARLGYNLRVTPYWREPKD